MAGKKIREEPLTMSPQVRRTTAVASRSYTYTPQLQLQLHFHFHLHLILHPERGANWQVQWRTINLICVAFNDFVMAAPGKVGQGNSPGS